MTAKQPIYKRVYSDIRKKIETGYYPVGVLLPPEPALEKEYDVSRTTVRKAVDLLMKDQFVSVKQGYGTEVIRSKAAQKLNQVTSVSQTLANMGYRVGVKSSYIQRIKADAFLAKELQILEGEPVLVVNRLQTANDIPITIAKNYIPEKKVPGLFEEKEPILSLYQYLSERYQIAITGLNDRISACNATFEEASALQTEPQTALLTVHRICYSGSEIVEMDDVKILASYYEYQSVL